MKTKLHRQEELIEAMAREWENIINFYKHQGPLSIRENKKSSGLANEAGLDRVHLKYQKDQISIEETGEDIDRLFITGNHFTFTTGIHFQKWYSKLEVNFPKVIYGNNIRNIRKKADLLKAVRLIEKELEENGVFIDVLSGKKNLFRNK